MASDGSIAEILSTELSTKAVVDDKTEKCEENEKVICEVVLQNGDIVEIRRMDVMEQILTFYDMYANLSYMKSGMGKRIPMQQFGSSAVKFAITNVQLFMEALARPEPNVEIFKAFEELTVEETKEVLKVADYLNCKPMITGTSKFIAHALGNCDPDTVKLWLDLEQDMTPEEIAEVEKYQLLADNCS